MNDNDLDELLDDDQSIKEAWEDWLEEESATPSEKLADKVADFGGSWWFICCFVVAVLLWVTWNVASPATRFDAYPFILLNLFLSMIAALQAPVIMMSQNRQEKRDRERASLDFRLSRKAEREIIMALKKEIRLLRIEQANTRKMLDDVKRRDS